MVHALYAGDGDFAQAMLMHQLYGAMRSKAKKDELGATEEKTAVSRAWRDVAGPRTWRDVVRHFVPEAVLPFVNPGVVGVGRAHWGWTDDGVEYPNNYSRALGAVGGLAGLTAQAALLYGLYRGGKDIYNRLRGPSEAAPVSEVPVQALPDSEEAKTASAGKVAARTPWLMTAAGAGLGAAMGAAHGVENDDPTENYWHHAMRGFTHGLVGAGAGAGLGYLAGRGVQKLAPNVITRFDNWKGPFPGAAQAHESQLRRQQLLDHAAFLERDHQEVPESLLKELAQIPHNPHAAYQDLAQRGFEIAMHPAARVLGGAAVGNWLTNKFYNWRDRQNLATYAAQKGLAEMDGDPNAPNLEMLKARYHMGDYRSSLDGRTA